MRASCIEIDLSAFKYNIKNIQNYVGKDVKLIPVIKANGYGTHINKQIHCINDFEIVAIALTEEGEKLRKRGYNKDILILNQPDILDLDSILTNKLTVGLSDSKFLKELIKTNKEVKVHLEIETGMGRTGISLPMLDEFITKLKEAKNIVVEGIYTHFSVADIDESYTNNQIKKFEIAIQKIEKNFGKLKYIHASASNGILNFENARFNSVRPGIIMYGYEPYRNTSSKLKLKPIAKLKSRINFIKTIEKGESVSYGRNFIANERVRIATVPIGYADGIKRVLSEKGAVVINGKKCKIIGAICMDSFMVDITDVTNVEIGTEVYIWDNDIITLDEVAQNCNTINYEILSTISERVPRKFIN